MLQACATSTAHTLTAKSSSFVSPSLAIGIASQNSVVAFTSSDPSPKVLLWGQEAAIRNSGSNSKYFGANRGITYYTLTSDQFTMLHGIVVPGTLRDSMYILATLLEQRTSLEPKEIMSDTAGYSDVVFGLFHLLGYQFSPRIKDVSDSRYWRVDREADYGKLNEISRHRINTGLIAQHWDDILRVVGSLKLNAVKATEVMRVLAKSGSLSSLGVM